jgi:hypothetical protein
LRSIDGAPRVTVIAEVLGVGEAPAGGDGDGDGDGDGGDGGLGGVDVDGGAMEPSPAVPDGGAADTPPAVGRVRGLKLMHHDDELRSHAWVDIAFRASSSAHPLHRYEVRISEQPITDLQSFLRGRPAKAATDALDGPYALMLPADVAQDDWVEGTIGDLSAETTYYVAVRAVDRRNRAGPLASASITTTERTFATVSPCFIATAAYGTPLAPEVSSLRRLRDRYLMSHALGRALVAQYYTWSPAMAEHVRQTPWLAALVRAALGLGSRALSCRG